MSNTKKAHINQLLFNDVFQCRQNIEVIEAGTFSKDSEGYIVGYLKQRIKLNEEILNDNGFYEERNINAQTPEEDAN